MKRKLALLLALVTVLSMSACGAKIAESSEADSVNSVTDGQTTSTAGAGETSKPDETTSTTATTPAPETEKPETTTETEKPESTTTAVTTVQTTATAATETTTTTATTAETKKPSPEWTESKASGTMYVNTGCYSRKKAVIGAETVKLYDVNDKVTVMAKTDTGYYKLSDGSFIHGDYLSESKVVITTTTKAPETEPPATKPPVTTTPKPTNPPATAPPKQDIPYGTISFEKQGRGWRYVSVDYMWDDTSKYWLKHYFGATDYISYLDPYIQIPDRDGSYDEEVVYGKRIWVYTG